MGLGKYGRRFKKVGIAYFQLVLSAYLLGEELSLRPNFHKEEEAWASIFRGSDFFERVELFT